MTCEHFCELLPAYCEQRLTSRDSAFVREHMEEVTVPLLAMHGGADAITPPQGTRDLVERAHSADKTLKIYDGLYHDLLREPEKQQVMSDIAAWMDEHAR